MYKHLSVSFSRVVIMYTLSYSQTQNLPELSRIPNTSRALHKTIEHLLQPLHRTNYCIFESPKTRPLTFLFCFSPFLLHTGVILVKHALLNAAELKGRRLIVPPAPPKKQQRRGWVFLALCSILFLRIELKEMSFIVYAHRDGEID